MSGVHSMKTADRSDVGTAAERRFIDRSHNQDSCYRVSNVGHTETHEQHFVRHSHKSNSFFVNAKSSTQPECFVAQNHTSADPRGLFG